MAEELNIVLKWVSETNIQAALIGPLITVVGYLVHRHISKKANLATLIQKIERLATEHWGSPASDENNRWRCMELQHEFKTLGWKIDQKNNARRKAALTDYRKAVTGDNFDDPERQFVPFENARIQLISEKAKNLRRVLKINKDY